MAFIKTKVLYSFLTTRSFVQIGNIKQMSRTPKSTLKKPLSLRKTVLSLLMLFTVSDYAVNVNNSNNVKSVPSHTKSGRGEVFCFSLEPLVTFSLFLEASKWLTLTVLSVSCLLCLWIVQPPKRRAGIALCVTVTASSNSRSGNLRSVIL